MDLPYNESGLHSINTRILSLTLHFFYFLFSSIVISFFIIIPPNLYNFEITESEGPQHILLAP